MAAMMFFRQSLFAVSGLTLAILVPANLFAQGAPVPLVQPADQYAEHLRTLAHNPHDLNALIGAGQSALSVGDATAAVNFFGRADAESRNDGRVKAGLGSALLLLERPEDALRLFSEATVLGVPQSVIAVDRGLAYDLRGDQGSAQRDYAMAMQSSASDELRRRYALSLGISGRKNEALSLLTPLLERQDQAAWRDRTFILAMNGDLRGANNITRSVMPAQADALAPFLKRLGQLTPAQQARAVTYGEMPEDGLPNAPTTFASASAPSQPVQVAAAQPVRTPAPTYEPRLAATQPVPLLPTPTRSPVPVTSALTPSPTTMLPRQPVAVTHTQQLAALGGEAGIIAKPVPLNSLPMPDTKPATPSFTSSPIQSAGTGLTGSTPVTPKQIVVPQPQPMEKLVVAAPKEVVQPLATSSASAKPTQPIAVTAQPRFTLSSLFDDMKMAPETPAVHVLTSTELHKAQLVQRKKAKADAVAKAKADEEAKAAAEAKAKEEAEAEAKAQLARENPARSWVQVATGNNRHGFKHSWNKLLEDHEALFKREHAWTVPVNRTFRILVGPFRTPKGARAFLSKMSDDGVSGNIYTSDAGEVVTPIGDE